MSRQTKTPTAGKTRPGSKKPINLGSTISRKLKSFVPHASGKGYFAQFTDGSTEEFESKAEAVKKLGKLLPREPRPKSLTKAVSSGADKPWAEQYLLNRAVSLDFAKKNLVKLYENRIVFQRTNPLTGEIIPSASSTRHKEPPIDPKTGKPMKFTRKSGQGNVLLYPLCLNWPEIFTDTTTPLFIVESECSALCLAERGLAAIGTGGKDSLFMVGTKRQKLHGDFGLMKLVGRDIYLAFDGDIDKPSVREAVEAATKLFLEVTR